MGIYSVIALGQAIYQHVDGEPDMSVPLRFRSNESRRHTGS